jgi:hypothetical protein
MYKNKSHYLLRFDDICPTMNWGIWAQIEQVLLPKHIKPIIAVVPDNRDPKLMVDAPARDFWAWVRLRQKDGWAVALHGYQHLYVNKSAGILGLTAQSEFATLPRADQREKLERGMEIFRRESVRVDAWVAPSHSFDWTTVDLLAELDIGIISDGPWPWPHTDARGITWVPQQLWTNLQRKRSGVWSVCCHHNSWTAETYVRFRYDMEKFWPQITSLAEVLTHFAGRRLRLTDRLLGQWFLFMQRRLRPVAGSVYRSLR